jgi:hypothetical protein
VVAFSECDSLDANSAGSEVEQQAQAYARGFPVVDTLRLMGLVKDFHLSVRFCAHLWFLFWILA